MKNVFAFTLALSALATSAAFASPQHSTVAASSNNAHAALVQSVKVAQTGSVKSSDGFKHAADGDVIVADNAKAFGSQYQRY
ncbi:hypothetical protein [Pseudomonas sp. dw_358]|uniref:hypothetical protein n=1 Tax=Pseudomonas sp. dw_358 TaxID=2720083 RepID=UPI001BD39D54|nr:hypothetical protein [Pseudomonas sp. dw_358]